MSQPARFDDEFVAGDSYPLRIKIDEDVIGGTATIYIRRALAEPYVVAKEAVLAPNGEIYFNLTPTETSKLNTAADHSTRFIYEVEYVSAEGVVSSILRGTFRVYKDLSLPY